MAWDEEGGEMNSLLSYMKMHRKKEMTNWRRKSAVMQRKVVLLGP